MFLGTKCGQKERGIQQNKSLGKVVRQQTNRNLLKNFRSLLLSQQGNKIFQYSLQPQDAAS